jgi:hypothetical protein
VKSDGRLVLVPRAQTADEAMEIIRKNVGVAMVRVGLTQYPAGIGVKDPSELKSSLVDACENLKMGTKMFSKVLRIVAKWYGNPSGADVFQPIFDDAIFAWQTGEFDGQSVFRASDPDTSMKNQARPHVASTLDPQPVAAPRGEDRTDHPSQEDIESAGMRVDLSKIGGH